MNLKNDRMISIHFQGKPCNITVIQVYALTSNAEGAEVGQCHEDLLGFPDSSVGKESACNAEDPGSIPGSRRSTGERIGYPLQYSLASLAAQLVKNPLAMQEISVQFLGQKIHWRGNRLPVLVYLRFPGGSPDNESACNVGDLGSIPGLGRSPGEGKGYPLQYPGLENSMDRGTRWDSLEKTLTLGKTEGQRRRGWQRLR